MDAQELRNLQEAYMEVVENQQLDEAYVEFTKDRYGPVSGRRKPSPRGKLKMKMATKELGNILAPHHRDAKKQGERIERMKSVRDTHSPEKAQAKSAANKEKGENKKRAFGNRLMRSDGQGIRDSYDYYDIILSHLLDEGYADTQEAAEAIMVNMSEEWRESIVEGFQPVSDNAAESMRRKEASLRPGGYPGQDTTANWKRHKKLQSGMAKTGVKPI
jgi:hypothetical protein